MKKKYFSVTFQYDEEVTCANIAHAESEEVVRKHYSKYSWVDIKECNEYDVEEARHRQKPIVEL